MQADLPARSSPGYHPLRFPLKDGSQERVLMRLATVILVLTAAAVLVIVSLIIATHS